MSRAVRLARGLWPNRNPLRRAADRAEAAVGAALLAAFLVGAPTAAVLAGHWAYATGMRTERAEQADRHKVPAVLLQDVPAPAYTPYGMVVLPVLARWSAPDGSSQAGLVSPEGGRAGTTIMVWTDASGHLVSAPLSARQVTRQVALAAVSAPLILGVLLVIAATITRRALDKRRLARWEADWEVTGPLWTSRR